MRATRIIATDDWRQRCTRARCSPAHDVLSRPARRRPRPSSRRLGRIGAQEAPRPQQFSSAPRRPSRNLTPPGRAHRVKRASDRNGRRRRSPGTPLSGRTARRQSPCSRPGPARSIDQAYALADAQGVEVAEVPLELLDELERLGAWVRARLDDLPHVAVASCGGSPG